MNVDKPTSQEDNNSVGTEFPTTEKEQVDSALPAAACDGPGGHEVRTDEEMGTNGAKGQWESEEKSPRPAAAVDQKYSQRGGEELGKEGNETNSQNLNINNIIGNKNRNTCSPIPQIPTSVVPQSQSTLPPRANDSQHSECGGGGNEAAVAATHEDDNQNTSPSTILECLPPLLQEETARLMKNLSMCDLAAALTCIHAISSALQKGLFIVSQGQKVHGNVYLVHVGDSGSGKKSLSNYASTLLSLYKEEEKKVAIDALEAKQELKDLEKASQKTGTPPLSEHLRELRTREKKVSYFGGQDTTGAYLARNMAFDRQGGFFTIMSDEGSLLLNRIHRKSADSYVTLFVNSFNDGFASVARVDNGEMSNYSISNPRMTLCMAIQPSLLRERLFDFPLEGGFLQRCSYNMSCPPVVGSIADNMFNQRTADTDTQTEFRNLLNYSVPHFIGGKNASEIQVGEEARVEIRNFVRTYEKERDEASNDSWKEYLARRIEFLLKFTVLFHAAESWDGKEIDKSKRLDPKSVKMAADCLDIVFRETEIFHAEFIAPLIASRTARHRGEKPGVEAVYEKALKLFATKKFPNGLLVGDIRQHYKRWLAVDEFRQMITDHPNYFKWTDDPEKHGSRIIPLIDGLAHEEEETNPTA